MSSPRLLAGCLPLLLACSPWTGADRPWRPVQPEIAGWIADHAVPVVDADGRLAMAPVCDAVPPGAILGLGESSHGVHELRAAQLAVVKCLAARPEPLTVLFETSYQWIAQLDAYVRGGARPELGSDVVATRDLDELLEWVRAHNRDLPPARQVRLGGLDVSCSIGCGEHVLAYVRAVDPPHAAQTEAALALLRAPWADHQADDGARLRAAVAAERAHLLAHRDAYTRAYDPDAWGEAVHRLDLLLASIDRALGSFPAPTDRDRVMADNVAWFRERARPGETLALVAHSGHVAASTTLLPNGRRSPPSMGEHLRRRFGPAYVPMHMTFQTGSFAAYRAGRIGSEEPGFANPLGVYRVPAPPRGTFEATLAGPRDPYLLDLRRLPADSVVARWFEWEQHVRNLGVAYRPAFARWPLSSVVWSRLSPALAYDLVLHFPVVSPVVPL
ncbi:erythromycin esterase family protein [Nannocystis bainbridge]|uniref:Erythromycin esterase family protein n=1 Tax=Nannocystis bainbridge TaxID=2995303 RepID=A0ABT5EBS7_9BACT|nr:erythromycin esterase family protein [Nannocystis bainbridge]MDC0722784.1 erythromycin esterase family protein [Nannocystis bainbridge]